MLALPKTVLGLPFGTASRQGVDLRAYGIFGLAREETDWTRKPETGWILFSPSIARPEGRSAMPGRAPDHKPRSRLLSMKHTRTLRRRANLLDHSRIAVSRGQHNGGDSRNS